MTHIFSFLFFAFLFSANSLNFKVENNVAFEIPLSNVTNATPGKNEVTIEFHQNDDAAVSLMEVRFYIPPDPDSEKDSVAVCRLAILFLSFCHDLCFKDVFDLLVLTKEKLGTHSQKLTLIPLLTQPVQS